MIRSAFAVMAGAFRLPGLPCHPAAGGKLKMYADARNKKHPLRCLVLVAGAGFEPTTFGL